MQNTLSCSSQRFATHDPSPQTMGLAGVFEFAKNSWQEAESRSTLSIAGHPQGARCLPCCHRAACASEASELAANDSDGGRCRGSRMGGVSDGLHSTFSQRLVFISIPPSASVLFSSVFHLQPASCFHLHFTLVQRPVSSVLKKIKKGVDRTGKVV